MNDPEYYTTKSAHKEVLHKQILEKKSKKKFTFFSATQRKVFFLEYLLFAHVSIWPTHPPTSLLT
jgi:hypothetical protein